MKSLQAILNLTSVIIVLIVNYLSQTGIFNNQTVGELSDKYENLFTPAGYAFSIWGLIFLGLIVFAVNHLILLVKNKDISFYASSGYWFALVNLANAAWVVCWLYEWTGTSVIIMAFMMFGLIKIILNTNMERWDAPNRIIFFSWWPICLYSGWINVALIANVSAYLSKIGWVGIVLNEVEWTMIMIIIATGINYFMIWKRNMREFAAVGIWALVAIFIRHLGSEDYIAWTAIIASVFLIINISIHAFINIKTNPFYRMMITKDN